MATLAKNAVLNNKKYYSYSLSGTYETSLSYYIIEIYYYLKLILITDKTDFIPIGHYQVNLIQITYHPKYFLNQVLRSVDIQHYLCLIVLRASGLKATSSEA